MNESYFPPRLSGFFVLLLSFSIFLSSIIFVIFKPVSPTRSQVPPDTSVLPVWNTFTDTKFGFEVKYPGSWTAKENNNISFNVVSLLPHNLNPEEYAADFSGTISIVSEKISPDITTEAEAWEYFQAFMDSCSSQTPTQCTQKNRDDYRFEKQILVAGRPAFQTYGGCCMDIGRHVFLYHNSRSYRFTLYNLNSETSLKNEELFNQILSTFKFLDLTSTPTPWSAFSDSKYGFVFSYPPNWSITDQNDASITFHTSDNNNFSVLITADSASTISEYLQKKDQQSATAYEGQPAYQVVSTKKTQIAGLNCIQRTEYLIAADANATVTYYKNGSDFIALRLFNIPGSTIQSDLQLYDRILSTFKFTR